MWVSGPEKAEKNRENESPKDLNFNQTSRKGLSFSRFFFAFPGYFASGLASKGRRARNHTLTTRAYSRFHKQLREIRLFADVSNIRKCGSRDEPPMTACGGNFIGGEIKRNELLSACSVERSETEGAQFFNCRPKPALPEGSSAGRPRSCDD